MTLMRLSYQHSLECSGMTQLTFYSQLGGGGIHTGRSTIYASIKKQAYNLKMAHLFKE